MAIVAACAMLPACLRFTSLDELNASLAHLATPAPLRTTFRLGLPQIDGDNLAVWKLRFDDVRCIRTP